MQKFIVIALAGAALALAGCEKQGGSSDQYKITTGAASNTNRDLLGITNNDQGAAISPGSITIGEGASTNSYGLATNDQSGAISPLDVPSGVKSEEPTNSVPEK